MIESTVSRGLPGVIIGLRRTIRNKGRSHMGTSHSLLGYQRNRATILPARVRANGNFSEAKSSSCTQCQTV